MQAGVLPAGYQRGASDILSGQLLRAVRTARLIEDRDLEAEPDSSLVQLLR